MNADLPVSTGLTPDGMRQLTREQIELIKLTIAMGATDDELKLFVHVCNSTGLNPFDREIYFFKSKGKAYMPVGIDGLRRKAAESGDYAGQVGPFWCGPDAVWKDIWLDDKPPTACKVGVLRHGNPEPTWGVVLWREFQRRGRGIPTWEMKSAHMLAIVAERHALRKGAPRLIKKLESAGARVLNGDYLIAKAEQTHRLEAPPYRAAQPNMHEDLYGQPEPTQQSAAQGETKSSEWTQADVAKFQRLVQKFKLSPEEWRELLGLPKDARGASLVALGTVNQVILQLMDCALADLTPESDGLEGTQPTEKTRGGQIEPPVPF